MNTIKQNFNDEENLSPNQGLDPARYTQLPGAVQSLEFHPKIEVKPSNKISTIKE